MSNRLRCQRSRVGSRSAGCACHPPRRQGVDPGGQPQGLRPATQIIALAHEA